MDLTNQTDQQLLALATPLMDNIMLTANRLDNTAHIRDFPRPVPEHFSEESFTEQCQAVRRRYGTYTNREYLGLTR
ncbi:hypothetical protein [Marinobacterium jannaschii]|uniref:hypothetical protein n=1 Tax=Marinobacterium jannaschii TaxID=64970 RepID=UPI000AE14888|nr:hypothetical protein [Marinobacterium jannaschii]